MVQYFGEACGRLGRLGEGLGNAWGMLRGGLGYIGRLVLYTLGLPGEAWEACGDLGSLGECLGMLRGGLVRLGEAWGMLGMYIHTDVHNASGRLG